MLSAFMEERNILWGELVGGLLIVGCSIALVISLWSRLEQIPYFPFLILAAITAALFGAGRYTLDHWKLESTSRGLLVIAMLLVPLDLLVLAGLSRGQPGGLVQIGTAVLALGLFVPLVSRGAAVLVPAGRWLLTLGVLGASASQLLVPHVLELREPIPWRFVLLGGLAVACQGVASGGFLVRLRRGTALQEADASAVFSFLGLTAFALAGALGFLVYWGGDVSLSLERLSPLIAVAGVPVLAAGVLLHRELAGRPELAGVRAGGTALALAGMTVMLLALALAWPEPHVVILVGALDFVVLTAVAFAFGLPVAHAVALPCLVLAYLTAFHLFSGHLGAERGEMAWRMARAATEPDGGLALAVLAGLLAVSAEALVRTGRGQHGALYTAGCGLVAVVSLALVSLHGEAGPFRAAVLSAAYAVGGLVLNSRWRVRLVDYACVWLPVAASLWMLQGLCPEQLWIWVFVVAALSTALAVAGGVLERLHEPDAQVREAPDSLARRVREGLFRHSLARACDSVALGAGMLALLLMPQTRSEPAFVWTASANAALAATAFLLAWTYRAPVLTWAGSALLLAAVTCGIRDGFDGITGPRLGMAGLLTHATLVLAGGLQWRRRPGERVVRIFQRPFLQSALVSSLLAVCVVPTWNRAEMAPLAVCLAWLAVVWLVLAWLWRARWLFAAFQAVVTAAVLCGITAWLDGQAWGWEQNPSWLFDPRSLQAYGIGLAGLSLAWNGARYLLRSNAEARALLQAGWPGVDWVGLAVAVPGLLLLTAWGIWPDLLTELAPRTLGQFPWPATYVHATGPGAWALLGASTLALLSSFGSGKRPYPVLGLALLAVTVPILAAGLFREQEAVASALRWGLALCFAACSIPIWQRHRLPQFGSRSAEVQVLLWLFCVAPALLLTTASVASEGGPGPGSVFFRMGWFASNLIPLGLITATLAGYAVRERSAEYAFAAGLGVNVLTAFTVWYPHHGQPFADWWVLLAQAEAIVFALLAVGWLWRSRLKEYTSSKTFLLATQAILGVVCNAILLLPCLGNLVVRPGDPTWAPVLQVGQVPGWLAFFLAAGAAIGSVRRLAPSYAVHAWAITGLGLATLAACFASRWDQGNWLAYHVLTSGWSLTGLALLVAGWAGAELPVARDFPLRETRGWVQAIALLVTLLALRGAGADPARPYGSVAATASAAALVGALGLWSRQQRYVYGSGLLLNLAGLHLWFAWMLEQAGGAGVWAAFVYTNVLGLAVGSVLWAAVELVLGRRTPPVGLRTRGVPYCQAAALVAVQLLAFTVAVGLLCDLVQEELHLVGPLAWPAWFAAAAALCFCLWDREAVFARGALYAAGLVGIGLFLHGRELHPRQLIGLAMWLSAGYVLLVSLYARVAPRLAGVRQVLGMAAQPADRWEIWFPVAQTVVAGLVMALSVAAALDFAPVSERMTGPIAVVLLVAAGVVLAEALAGAWRNGVRYATLALAVLALAEAGWAVLDVNDVALGLHRTAWLVIALGGATLAYAVGLQKVLAESSPWTACGQQLAAVLGGLAAAVIVVVLVQEFLLFNPAVRRAPMAAWAVLGVLGALAGLVAACIGLALAPGTAYFRQTDRRRTLYVYAAELFVLLLVVHLRLTVPWIFPQFNARMWPFVVMAVAFVGAGLAELFQRKGLRVLAAPLRNTGLFLPLLPLIAFWARPPAALLQLAGDRLPGAVPLLAYLDRLPHSLGDHAVVWFLLGLLYAYVAVTARSFRFALASALAANFGLWALLHHGGVEFLVHPQAWLIPLAVILLVAEHLNRDRLSHYQCLTIRYFALLLLYVSSTADLFIAGLGNSVALPLVLAILSVLGVLAGIQLRVRAFLVMGVAFLFLDVFSMIWHAAVDLYQTWIWWASGILLGVAILALFAVFEKRRQNVLHLLDEVKRWE
jgi:hypothetical protein